MTENETDTKLVEEVVAEYTKAIDLFKKKEYPGAGELFKHIVDTYGDSDDYHVLEVQARAAVYYKICQAQMQELNKLAPESHEEYLSDGIYHLNDGNCDAALECFNYLENKEYDNPYLFYLTSLCYLHKEDIENCLKYLKLAIEKDEHYKVVAHNEPEFDLMFENEEFNSLIEMEESF